MKGSIGIGGTRDTLLKRIFKTHRCWILLLLKHVVLEWSKNLESIKLTNSQNHTVPTVPQFVSVVCPTPIDHQVFLQAFTACGSHLGGQAHGMAFLHFLGWHVGLAAEPGRGWIWILSMAEKSSSQWQNMATPRYKTWQAISPEMVGTVNLPNWSVILVDSRVSHMGMFPVVFFLKLSRIS